MMVPLVVALQPAGSMQPWLLKPTEVREVKVVFPVKQELVLVEQLISELLTQKPKIP